MRFGVYLAAQVGGWVRGLGFAVVLDGRAEAACPTVRGAGGIEPPLLPGAQGGACSCTGPRSCAGPTCSSIGGGFFSKSLSRGMRGCCSRLWAVSGVGGVAEVGGWVWGLGFV